MAEEAIRCLHCQSEAVVKYGRASNGKERFRCQQMGECGRTFIRAYAYPGRLPAVKRQIIEMTLNGSGVRDIARVLQVSPTTVIGEIKKGQHALLSQQKCRGRVLSGSDHGRDPPGRGGRGGRNVEFCAEQSTSALVMACD